MKDKSRKKELSWLLGPAGGLALLLLGAAGVSQWRVAQVEQETGGLFVNSLPSVRDLSAARSNLTRVETDAAMVLTAPPHPQPDLVDDLRENMDELHARVARYSNTPWYPGERELYERDLVPRLARLDADVARLGSAEGAGGGDAERRAAAAAVVGDADGADDATADLLDLNHDQSYAAASRIVETRRSALTLAVVLDALAIGVGLLLLMLSARAFRRLRAVEADHARLLEDRASELEAFGLRVGHDLVSPLAAVSFTLATLERQDPTDSTKRLIARGIRALARSQRLVRGLFEFARAGARPVAGARAGLSDAVQAAIDELAMSDPGTQQVTIEQLDDCEVACDEGVLHTVLANLLGNAAKYSRGAAVERIIVRARRLASRRVCVEVEDFGPGIPRGLERSIFEPYVRAPGATQGGLGLGLATVHRVVTAHGGAVGVRRKEQGTIFWFELPRVEDEEPDSDEAPPGEAVAIH